MALVLDEASLGTAFQGRLDIQNAVRAASTVGPHYVELFNQISQHVCTLVRDNDAAAEPAMKKRRLDGLESRPAGNANGMNGNGHSTAPNGSAPVPVEASSADPVLLEVKDISVVIPQRKKYTLCFTASHLYAKLPGSSEPAAGMSFAWNDIEHIFCLPVPEKTQKQHNYILFPRHSTLHPSKPIPGVPPPPEPLVFTIPDSAPKPGCVGGSLAATAAAVGDEYKTLFNWAISTRLKEAGKGKVKIVEADPKIFASEQRQAHRPSEKAVFVKGFRGSKDGYLFFLPGGILWGFKKPLLYLPHERIVGVSYVNVLQRTFNLSVEVDTSIDGEASGAEGGDGDKPGTGTEEFEFAMLDQEDFAGIDTFVKRHGLQDKSMAEQRRAKRLNVNVVKDEDGNIVGNVEAGELERAAMEAGEGGDGEGLERMMGMDDEDEDDEGEDYDPGSEGESEGSGTSESESDDGDEDGGEEDEDDDDGEGEDEL